MKINCILYVNYSVMNKKQAISFLVAGILLVQSLSSMAQSIAFPGAEGFGQYTTGGRGGKVMVVTTLDDSGPGSFRQAAEAKEPRIIVFAVSGTIHLQSKLEIKGNASFAGQSAPGD